MELLTIIDKYVEICIKFENLKDAVNESKFGYKIVKTESDLASEKNDAEIEEKLDKSADIRLEIQKKAEEKLKETGAELQKLNQQYIQAITFLNLFEIRDVLDAVKAKKEAIEKKVQDLAESKEKAIVDDGKVYIGNDNTSEKGLKQVFPDSFVEISQIQPAIHYYDSFIRDLNKRIEAKTR